jgi:hypothetical protein
MDDIIVEGGHQQIASILADKNRAGFKQEFKSWLDSIEQYPKGYDFKFGDLAELLDINFQVMFKQLQKIKGFKPCWEHNIRSDGSYSEEIKDDNGDRTAVNRTCSFTSEKDFVRQMNTKRLSLKRAIAVYAENKGQTGNDLTLPAGSTNCERKEEGSKEISYEDMTDGSQFLVEFKLKTSIGDKIAPNDAVLVSFHPHTTKDSNETNMGRWMVSYGGRPDASQISRRMKKTDKHTVMIKEVEFTLVPGSDVTTLEWTEENCRKNLRRFQHLRGI